MVEQSIEFRYDTQLLLDFYVEDGEDADDVADDLVDEIRDHILSTFQGDSMVVAGDSGTDENGEKAIVKLHYHTQMEFQHIKQENGKEYYHVNFIHIKE